MAYFLCFVFFHSILNLNRKRAKANLNSVKSFLQMEIRNTIKQMIRTIKIKIILIMFQPPILCDVFWPNALHVIRKSF